MRVRKILRMVFVVKKKIYKIIGCSILVYGRELGIFKLFRGFCI